MIYFNFFFIMAIAYTTDEMVSVSEYQKHMAKYNESLRTKKRKKIALMKNNSVDLVVISSEELNNLYKSSEILEEYMEDLELLRVVEERKNSKIEDGYSLEEVMKELNITNEDLLNTPDDK